MNNDANVSQGGRISRRQFLRRTAVTTAAVALPWRSRGAAANERINVGLIGKGAMGSGHLRRLVDDPIVQVVGVCDVDGTRCAAAQRIVEDTYALAHQKGTYRGCGAYNDYRELLVRSDLDAVVIATPDHWHSLIAIDAAKAGKDVYCEKPVSLNLREGREVVQAVQRTARVFQTGTQYRSIPTIRRVCEFVRGGGLGRIKSVFTLWGKYDIPQLGPSYVPLDPMLPAMPVPDGLDWDMWVGPATWRPYNALYHRNPSPGVVPWVFCDAFGAVAVTGYQSHAADVIQYAINAETTGPVEILHPSQSSYPTLTFRYGSGTLLHHVDDWGQVKELYHAVPADARLAGNFGGVFVGERGWLTSMSTGGPVEGGPTEIWNDLKLESREVTIAANNHHANWFECLLRRTRPSAYEEIGHRSASLGHLAIIAYILGCSLQWDPVGEHFIGNEAANRLRARAMREPWRI